MSTELLTGLVTLVVLLGVVALRYTTGGQTQVTLNHAIIAAIATGLTLLVSGRISKVGDRQRMATFDPKAEGPGRQSVWICGFTA